MVVSDPFQRRCTIPFGWNHVDPAFLFATEPFLQLYAELPVLGLVVTRCPLVLCAVPTMLDEILTLRGHLILFLLNSNTIFNFVSLYKNFS